MGDFNINKMNDDYMCKKIIDFFQSNGMYQLIHEHTRVTDTSNSINNNAYVSNFDNIIQVNIPKLGLSDHLPICLVFKRRFSGKSDHTHITYKFFKFVNEVDFCNDLSTIGTY